MVTLLLVGMTLLLGLGVAFFVYATYVKPRQVQERVWRAVATRLGAHVEDQGFIRGLSLSARVGEASVAVVRNNFGSFEREAGAEAGPLESDNSIRTYLSAEVLSIGTPSGPCLITRDASRPLLGNDRVAVDRGLADLEPLLRLVRPKIEHLVVGRGRVDLKLSDNAVAEEAILDAAIELVGRLAGGVPQVEARDGSAALAA